MEKTNISKLDDSILLLLRMKALTIPELCTRSFYSKEQLLHYIYSNINSETNSYFETLESDIALSLPERAKPRKECAVKKESVWQVVKGRLNTKRHLTDGDCAFLSNMFGAKDIVDLKARAIHIHFSEKEKVSSADVKAVAKIFGERTWASFCGKTDKVVVSASLLKRLYGKVNEKNISKTILDSIALYLSGRHWDDFANDRTLQDNIREDLMSILVECGSQTFRPSRTFFISYLLEPGKVIEVYYDEEGKNFLRLSHLTGNEFEVLETTSQRLHKGDIITVLQFEVGRKFIGHVKYKNNGELSQMTYQSRTITKLKKTK